MFGKKTTAEELVKLFSVLSDEEKQKFLDEVNGSNDADSAPEGNAVETDKEKESAPTEETADGATDTEESDPKPTESAPVEETAAAEEEASASEAPPAPENQTQDNFAEVLEGLGKRLTAIEEALKGFTELKEQMEKFTQAQADSFGYSGTVSGNRKDYGEMSAEEMKEKILNGEI